MYLNSGYSYTFRNNFREYRFAFNGQERDDEIAGVGNIMTAEFWEYDSRLGRRWNLDPISNLEISQYVCFNDNPLVFIDPKGDYSKIGATIRNFLNGGGGVYITGEGKHKDWGYNTLTHDENGKIDGWAANFGGTRKNASNLSQVLKNSLWHHSDYTDLKGDVLDKIKRSPEMKDFNRRMVKLGKELYKDLKEESASKIINEGLVFGGKTDHPLDITDPNTMSVALNELTWIVRHVDITARIEVNKNGAMKIQYLILDDLDLKPSFNHGFKYSAVTTVLGAVYQGMLWGTSSKIRASWEVNKKLK